MAQHQEDFNKDTYIKSTDPDTAHGDWEELFAEISGTVKAPTGRNVLARVDFSGEGITAGNVDSAYLRMYCYSQLIMSTSYVLTWYKCLRAWVELEATWNIYSTGNNWATAGCLGLNTDYASGLYSDGKEEAGADVGWHEWDIWLGGGVNSVLKDAIDNESSVLSLVLAGVTDDYEVANWVGFYSRDHDGSEPYIEINYTPVAGGDIKQLIIPWASVKKVSGVAEASIKKVSGVSAN